MLFDQHLEQNKNINLAEELELDVDLGVESDVESDVDLAQLPRAQHKAAT